MFTSNFPVAANPESRIFCCYMPKFADCSPLAISSGERGRPVGLAVSLRPRDRRWRRPWLRAFQVPIHVDVTSDNAVFVVNVQRTTDTPGLARRAAVPVSRSAVESISHHKLGGCR